MGLFLWIETQEETARRNDSTAAATPTQGSQETKMGLEIDQEKVALPAARRGNERCSVRRYWGFLTWPTFQ